MTPLPALVIREFSAPEWPPAFRGSATVPIDASPAAHTEAGRRAALDALVRAGCSIVELPARSGPRPVWPRGFVGSIAHDDALAIAVVSRISDAVAIGIDVERFDALSALDASFVLQEDERALAGDNPSTATLLWSAKESAFKAWCTGLDVDLDHVDPRDIHIQLLHTDGAAFVAQATGPLRQRAAAIGPLRGCSTRVDDVVITLAWAAAAGAR